MQCLQRSLMRLDACMPAQVASTMYNLPAVLLRDVTRDLLPTYEYLRSLGLADDNLTGILRTCAPLPGRAIRHQPAGQRCWCDWSRLRELGRTNGCRPASKTLNQPMYCCACSCMFACFVCK